MGERMSEMTGLERLRELGREQEERSWSTVGKVRGRLMGEIARQIEDERLRERLAVERVASEMELHFLGVEGMDDSPVARWARELRAALGGHVEEVADVATIRKDAYDAYEWVEAHGGLECVRQQIEIGDRVGKWLGERSAKTSPSGKQVFADEAMASLDRRLMPEGCFWPHFEDGEPVKLGEEAIGFVRTPSFVVDHVVILAGGEATVCAEASHDSGKVENFVRIFPGEHVKRPAPMVLDADGAEIRVGDEVWLTDGLGPWSVSRIVVADRMRVVCDDEKNGHLNVYPENITHRAPVLAADGRPLREGETVWSTGREQHEYVVLGQPGLGGGTGRFKVACHDVTDDIDCDCDPSQLTHERPDSYDALWEDIEACAVGYEGFMRRAKALAERDA